MGSIQILLVEIVKIRNKRFVDAKPLFTPNGVALPTLRNVPVALFGNNKNHIDWHIEVGDIMPYLIATFDMSSYISQGSKDIMDTNRRNNINSGFILPLTIPNMMGTLNFPSDIRIIGNRLEKGNIEQTGNKTQIGNVEQTGNLTSTGTVTGSTDVIAAEKSMKNHKHSGVSKGVETSGEVI